MALNGAVSSRAAESGARAADRCASSRPSRASRGGRSSRRTTAGAAPRRSRAGRSRPAGPTPARRAARAAIAALRPRDALPARCRSADRGRPRAGRRSRCRSRWSAHRRASAAAPAPGPRAPDRLPAAAAASRARTDRIRSASDAVALTVNVRPEDGIRPAGFVEFVGKRARHGVARSEERKRDAGFGSGRFVADHHRDGHRFAERAAKTEDNCADDSQPRHTAERPGSLFPTRSRPWRRSLLAARGEWPSGCRA